MNPSPETGSTNSAARHEFDEAIRLAPDGNDAWRGETHAAYANMVGPYGGITAAVMLNAACQHPDRLGDPLSLTVNFAGPVADGPFRILARAARTNRTTQHWSLELRQGDQLTTTATAVFALRRETWASTESTFPDVPPAASVARTAGSLRVAWVRKYDMRVVRGPIPDPQRPSPEQGADSVTTLWIRDDPPRPLDFVSLASISDCFFPRVYLRKQAILPAGTVSLTTYFHADRAALERQGDRHLLATARAARIGGGFADQVAEIWGDDGVVLATSHQILYFKG